MNIKRLIIIGNGMDIDHKLGLWWDDIYDKDVKKYLSGLTEKMNFLFSDNFNHKMWNDFEKKLGLVRDVWLSALLEDSHEFENTLKEYNKEDDGIFNVIQQEVRLLQDLCRKFCKEANKTPELNDEQRSKLAKSFCKKNGLIDHSMQLKTKLIEKIHKLIDEKYPSLKEKEKYKAIFSEKDFYVINYNYTEIYYENLNYYKNSDVAHIHGIINKRTQYKNHEPDGMHDKDLGLIKLGLYKSSISISKKLIDFKKIEIEENNANKKNVVAFMQLIGNTNLFFSKGYSSMMNEKQYGLDKNLSSITEAIIIGHSLSGNDLPYLKEWVPNIDLDKIKKVTYYSVYPKDKPYEKEKEKKKIKKSFTNVKHIIIFDNSKDSSQPIDDFFV